MKCDSEIFGIGDSAVALVERADGTIDLPGIKLDFSGVDRALLGCGGVFHARCLGPDGTVRWADDAKNMVVNLALNDLLNVVLRNTTQTAAWYIGLVDATSFTGFNPTDTAATHSGWIENVGFSNSTRVTWSPTVASSQAVTNTTTADFNMTSTASIKGLFLSSSNVLSPGTAGALFSTALFSGGTQGVNNGDTLKITYTVSATSS